MNMYACDRPTPKQCFCVGVDKCKDMDCPLVQEYEKNKEKGHNPRI